MKPVLAEVHGDAIERMSMHAARASLIDAESIPWWAVALLETVTGDELRVRRHLMRGMSNTLTGRVADRYWSAFTSLIAKAEQLADRMPLEKWREQAYNELDHADVLDGGGTTTQALRDAALMGLRPFTQICELRDEDDNLYVHEDFHVRAFDAMRRNERPASILLPFQFGKSVLSSLLVPLMDWCEWNNATEGRVYHAENHVAKWINRLMQQVERNDAMHQVFPWVSKPTKDDACYGIWSTEGFAIRGRTIRDRSFEPLTIGAGKTGLRYHRTGVDDVVVSKEAASLPIQQRNYDYLTTGVFTTKQRTTRKSRYGTVFPGLYIVGTLFEQNDVNFRMHQYFDHKDWRTVKFDIYPKGQVAARDHGIVLWPTVMPYSACRALEEELGQAAFEKRCRNMVRPDGRIAFPMEQLRAAESPAWEWGVIPSHTRAMIGFDPGSGKITKWSKNPAVVVYGEQDLTFTRSAEQRAAWRDDSDRGGDPDDRTELDYWKDTLVHLCEFHRLRGYTFPMQCEFLADLATRLQIPLAFEDNHIQSAYGEEINRRFPWVRTICHTTSDNKRDPKQGVETFSPLFARNLVVIHARNAPTDKLTELRTEFGNWPNGHNTDLVMAAWIAKFQMHHERGQRIHRTVQPSSLPAYARHFSGYRRHRLLSRPA